MRYVIGVDGAPTGTVAVVADECGNLLGSGHGGSANTLHETGGAERLRHSVSEAIKAAITSADLQNARIAAACLGISGDAEELECICAPVVPTDRLLIGLPSHIAFNAVTLGQPGVVIVADTGMEAYGRNRGKESRSAGGWGHLLGDEGSEYWIAVRALNACCRAQDRTGPETQLHSLLLKHLEADSLKHVQHRIHSGMMARTDIAGLAEIVVLAAAQGDVTARRLLREAGKELGLTAIALLRQLQMHEETVTVGTVGGVFRAGRSVLRSFREVVQRTAPQAAITGLRAPLCVGAALLAFDRIGVSTSEKMLGNIVATLPKLNLKAC